jgi:predicted neuraminidase
MLQQTFIYETAPFPSCHASTLAETADGTLVSAWFGGQDEGAPDVSIWLSRRESGRWTAPAKVAAGSGVPCWNPVLHQVRRGPLLLFYKIGPSPQTWSGALIRSTDGGRSWSRPELLPAGILGPIKNKPFELRDGTLVCGSSVESYQLWGCWVERTRDQGKTWEKRGPINLPGHLYGSIQPAVFGAGERLAMLCRTRGIHQMVRAASDDGGRTWTPLSLIDLPQNNSGLDAVRLKDGRVVLIYNHATSGRTPLNLAVSGDMGKTWTRGPVLENEPGEYSYPAIIQAADGTVHATYTWKRERIRHASLQPDDLPRA